MVSEHLLRTRRCTDKPKRDKRLTRHLRVCSLYTPRRTFWLNQIEIQMPIMSGKSCKQESFGSGLKLAAYVYSAIGLHNEKVRLFVWPSESAVAHQPLKP